MPESPVTLAGGGEGGRAGKGGSDGEQEQGRHTARAGRQSSGTALPESCAVLPEGSRGLRQQNNAQLAADTGTEGEDFYCSTLVDIMPRRRLNRRTQPLRILCLHYFVSGVRLVPEVRGSTSVGVGS